MSRRRRILGAGFLVLLAVGAVVSIVIGANSDCVQQPVGSGQGSSRCQPLVENSGEDADSSGITREEAEELNANFADGDGRILDARLSDDAAEVRVTIENVSKADDVYSVVVITGGIAYASEATPVGSERMATVTVAVNSAARSGTELQIRLDSVKLGEGVDMETIRR